MLRFLRWLFWPTNTWLSFIVLASALVYALVIDTSEQSIRWTGLALQLCGISTVLWGIHKIRSFFGLPSPLNGVKSWLMSAPFWPKKTVLGSVNVQLESLRCHGRGHQTFKPSTRETEDRLDALEKNVDAINGRISGFQSEVDQEVRRLSNDLHEEKGNRAYAHQNLEDKLKNVGTSGAYISVIGAVWLFVGVILSTASPELSKWLT